MDIDEDSEDEDPVRQALFSLIQPNALTLPNSQPFRTTTSSLSSGEWRHIRGALSAQMRKEKKRSEFWRKFATDFPEEWDLLGEHRTKDRFGVLVPLPPSLKVVEAETFFNNMSFFLKHLLVPRLKLARMKGSRRIRFNQYRKVHLLLMSVVLGSLCAMIHILTIQKQQALDQFLKRATNEDPHATLFVGNGLWPDICGLQSAPSASTWRHVQKSHRGLVYFVDEHKTSQVLLSLTQILSLCAVSYLGGMLCL